MKPLGEYLRERAASSLPVLHGQAVFALAGLGVSLQPQEAKKLAKSLNKFAATEEFAKLVDNAVGTPKSGESEDVFVDRAKEAIFRALLKRFGA